jgi:putative transposase
MDILTLLGSCSTLTTAATVRQMAIIAQAMLTMTGRVTMLNLSRWTAKGGSYRTIQRFFARRLPWTELLIELFRQHLFDQTDEYIVGGDATTITKAGNQTHGIDRFFSGVLGQVVKGLEFFVFSLISVKQRKSYPLMVGQTVRSEAEKAILKQRREKRWAQRREPKNKRRKKRGRPTGVKNKETGQVEFSSELVRINSCLKRLLKLIRCFVTVKHLVLDGHFGHAQAVLMGQANGLELVSKLRCDAALYEKYEGEYRGKGRRKKYGEKLSYDKLPTKYLKKSELEGGVTTNYYHGIFLNRKFGSPLNVVIIEKKNVKKAKVGHVILFSSDVELGWEKLLEYYSLRFQIEFNFRDAKQHFGLEDFMNQTPTGVENAANLAFLMVNLSAKLLAQKAESCVGINDLKSQFRGIFYALETIKIVEPKAERILIEKVKEVISRIGSIHRYNFSNSSA